LKFKITKADSLKEGCFMLEDLRDEMESIESRLKEMGVSL